MLAYLVCWMGIKRFAAHDDDKQGPAAELDETCTAQLAGSRSGQCIAIYTHLDLTGL